MQRGTRNIINYNIPQLLTKYCINYSKSWFISHNNLFKYSSCRFLHSQLPKAQLANFANNSTANAPSATFEQLQSKYNALVDRIGLTQFKREITWLLDDYSLNSTSLGAFDAQLSELSAENRAHLLNYLHKRQEGFPMQYILGKTQFLGLELLCRAPILIPRPETEQICDWFIYCHALASKKITNNEVNLARKWPEAIPLQYSAILQPKINAKTAQNAENRRNFNIIDICSGSGNIALSLASYISPSTATGIDINPAAISLANSNLSTVITQLRRPINCRFSEGNALQILDSSPLSCALRHSFDLIVANPPYIDEKELKNLQVEIRNYEDSRALIAGKQGLQFFEAIIEQSKDLLSPLDEKQAQFGQRTSQYPDFLHLPEILLEFGNSAQVLPLKLALTEQKFARIEVFRDLNGLERWIAASRIAAIA
jgi:release factor glutamine methyltransferase